ncbi:imidazole glycerol phosphate synthase subunit HisH [Bacterioplanes sanyensis]|uniref:Imidazole glycerol phosphate synthase subunit HisH n=1 Tax=Bacterioplanes sanyensis TaxID=1249553 RepID=A0A222FP42_9GAMM|nr:imidazole glycerol phosphate synthase subunit HisH [Bacterioplanes sanyensis]ASP40795.1 imidazole glycerol phosphate synthase subunit HisH [Bacterioplanes sanyensis]
MSKVCAVIDYGMGNLHSAHGALQHVSPETNVVVTSDPEQILAADHVVLPGVGAIRDCIAEIRAHGIDQVVDEVRSSKPLLGICVGLQSMLQHSAENGGVDGMGLFAGEVKFFGEQPEAQQQQLKVPHMGWNQVQQRPHPLWQGIDDNSRFYFVHSYYVVAADATQVVGQCQYGVTFDAALAQDNVFAVQFHPEKSHRAGLALLKNFLAWDGQG